jgi:hypothetical protein
MRNDLDAQGLAMTVEVTEHLWITLADGWVHVSGCRQVPRA